MKPELDISVVVPLFNEEESLPELMAWIDRVMQENKFTYEVVMVDDGSTDRSWEVIQELKIKFQAVRGIRFLRNYGKSAGLQKGFQATNGNVVITMDADLQDSPDEIPGLYKMITEEGYDLVSGWKRKRYDPISKTIPSKFFNYMTRLVSGIRLHDFNCGLKAYRHELVKRIEVYGEMHRYIPVIAKWTGFGKIAEKEVEHRARKYGTTKFGLERFINGFLDLLSITFVSRFSKKPMHFFGLLGTMSFGAGFLFTLWLVLEKFVRSHMSLPIARDVVDQPLFFLALTAVVIGVQLFLAGFVSEMVSRNSPHRNDYHVKEVID
jgi:glycosyltransferase involved in cell wall biosynthesis